MGILVTFKQHWYNGGIMLEKLDHFISRVIIITMYCESMPVICLVPIGAALSGENKSITAKRTGKRIIKRMTLYIT